MNWIAILKLVGSGELNAALAVLVQHLTGSLEMALGSAAAGTVIVFVSVTAGKLVVPGSFAVRAPIRYEKLPVSGVPSVVIGGVPLPTVPPLVVIDGVSVGRIWASKPAVAAMPQPAGVPVPAAPTSKLPLMGVCGFAPLAPFAVVSK